MPDGRLPSTQYRSAFMRAFPVGTPYTTGFQLPRVTAAQLREPPSLDVILVTGNNNPTTRDICDRFAHDFNFAHLNVPEYLQQLDTLQYEGKEDALGCLHLQALETALVVGADITPNSKLRIVRYKIDDLVEWGRTRIMISGLDDDAQTAMTFSDKIAKPSLLISLVEDTEQVISDIRASIEEYCADLVLPIGYSATKSAEESYQKLLAILYQRAALGVWNDSAATSL